MDAIVIGAGQNGLVAANMLADAGWSVLVLEAAEEPGGAVRTGELTLPGYRHDLFSSFYPLTAASPVYHRMELERHGLRWCRGPLAFAHPAADGTCPYVAQGDVEDTISSLAGGAGDAREWRELTALWDRIGETIMEALTAGFPPVVPAAKLLAGLRTDVLEFARFGTLPVRRFSDERFRSSLPGRLLTGNAMHADFHPESAGSALFGWVLVGLASDVGFPVPQGGASAIIDALVARLEERGGQVRCSSPVERVLVRRNQAQGVRLAGGEEIGAGRAVLADVGAPRLFLDMLEGASLPSRFVRELRRFQYDSATVKVDWALRAPIPWSAPDARRAPTLHVAESVDELSVSTGQIARGLIPELPFLVMGQYSMGDATRQPEGAETAWAYTHLPQDVRGDAGGEISGTWDERDEELIAERIERRVEALAPGFRDLIAGRHVFTPRSMEAANPNLVNGAVNGGTAQMHQQLIFRPVPSVRRSATPVRGLYLASASAHPGGGVHGAAGMNAARAALAHHRVRTGGGLLRRRHDAT
jgi:phytoene dehydrogenase-like protein